MADKNEAVKGGGKIVVKMCKKRSARQDSNR